MKKSLLYFLSSLVLLCVFSVGCTTGGYYYKRSNEKADPAKGYLPSLKHINKTKTPITKKKI